MIVRRELCGIATAYMLALGLFTLGSTAAQSQTWPNRIVRLIVPYPAGGELTRSLALLAANYPRGGGSRY